MTQVVPPPYGTQWYSLPTGPTNPAGGPGPCQHSVDGLKVFCDQCNGFALFHRDYHGRSLITQVSFLIVSVFVILVLFRLTNLVWPAYLFVGLGFVFLLAAVLSRGRAMTTATTVLTAFALCWTLLEITGDYLPLPSTLTSRAISAATGVVLASLLALAVVLMFVLGRTTAVESLRRTSSYFLAAGTFVVGFTALWAIMLQNHLVTDVTFQIVLSLGAAAPLPVIVHLLAQGEFDSKGSRFSLAFALLAAYVSVTTSLVSWLAYLLGTFLPRIIGASPVRQPRLPWLSFLGWRNLLGSFLLVSALVIISATSWSEAFDAYRVRRRRQSRQAESTSSDNPLLALPILAQRLVLQAATYAVALGELLARFLVRFAHNIRTIVANLFSYVLKLLRHFVVPVTVFASISVTMLLLLSELRAYDMGNSPYEPRALWGALVTLLIGAIVLSGVAFGLTPTGTEKGNWQDLILTVTTNSGLAGFMLYYLLSVVSLGLMPLSFTLENTGFALRGITPGPLYLVNLTAVGILSAAALALAGARYAVGRGAGGERVQMVLALILIGGFSAITFYLGIEPLRHALDVALSGTNGRM